MSLVVATISLEQELTKEKALELATVALRFIKSHSRMSIIVCENPYDIALVFKAECDKYIQIDTQNPDRILVPIIDLDSGLEEFVEPKILDNIEHILLTTCEARKHDRVRHDLTILVHNSGSVQSLIDALESEGMFYE